MEVVHSDLNRSIVLGKSDPAAEYNSLVSIIEEQDSHMPLALDKGGQRSFNWT